MAIPLLMTGPGGDYVTRYDVKGHSLVRNVGQALGQQPDTETAGSFAGYGRQSRRQPQQPQAADNSAAVRGSDVFEHQGPIPIHLYRPAAPAGRRQAERQPDGSLYAVAAAIDAWLAAQQRALTELARLLPRLTAFAPAEQFAELDEDDADPDACNLATSALETAHAQSHSQTTPHPHTDPRPAAGTRLFAEYAGTGGRTGREQGHDLRAHRSPHQKRRPPTRPAQSSLFGT